MMYFDAAYLAKCYLKEPGTQDVIRLAATVESIASCELARLEVLLTIRRHRREGRLSERQMLQIWQDFEADEGEGRWVWLPLSARLVRATCERIIAMPRDVFLRSIDALHLACAVEHGFEEVYSNDRHMLAAAPHFGLKGVNILS